jgi:CRISPR-associated endonuclease Csn1
MSTTLGLDVGANSIGWCLIEDGKRIIDLGVRIFADGRDAKSGTSLAVDRRIARGLPLRIGSVRPVARRRGRSTPADRP